MVASLEEVLAEMPCSEAPSTEGPVGRLPRE
jgi:hypothetical protein